MSEIEQFLRYLRLELNRSPNTVLAYGKDLRLFARFLTGGKEDSFDVDDVTTSDVRAWLSDMGRRGEKATSIRRRTLAVKSFYRFLKKRGRLTVNPAEEILLAKLPKPLPHFIKSDEMEMVLQSLSDIMAAQPDNVMAARDHLIMHLLYATGLRRAEAVSLTDGDFSKERNELRVMGKGSKERVIPIADELAREISRWQTMRDAAWPQLPQPAAIIATSHGSMTDGTLGVIVKRLLSGTSTDRKSAHTIRHSFATGMLNGGAELDCVREMLGHTSVATTQIYTHLTLDDLRRQYDAAHPRSFRNKKS